MEKNISIWVQSSSDSNEHYHITPRPNQYNQLIRWLRKNAGFLLRLFLHGYIVGLGMDIFSR